MKHVLTHFILLILLAYLPLTTVAESAPPPLQPLQVSDAWIREVPPGMSMTAGYFTLDNPNAEELILTQVVSPHFDRVELHQTLIEKGMAKMRSVKQLTLPAHGRLKLMPSGHHLMLSEPTEPFNADSEIELTLHFSNEYQQTLVLPVLSLTELEQVLQE